MLHATMRPLISVIVPCYGQAHLLPQAVASVQAQDVADWELLVVDDGSPDDTAAAASRLAGADPRVRLIRKPNGGLSSARNAGLDVAAGRFVQFLDADDLLLPGKFTADIAALAGLDQNALAVDDFAYLHPDGNTHVNAYCAPRMGGNDAELEVALRWELELSIPIHCPLFTADLFAPGAVRFDEQLPNHEDFGMWLALLARQPTLRVTGRKGALYRMNPAGMTRNRQRMYEGFVAAIRARMAQPDVRPVVRQALKAKLAVVRNQYGFGPRAAVRKALLRPMLRRTVPWPLQQALRRWTLADAPAHQSAVCRQFGLPGPAADNSGR